MIGTHIYETLGWRLNRISFGHTGGVRFTFVTRRGTAWSLPPGDFGFEAFALRGFACIGGLYD